MIAVVGLLVGIWILLIAVSIVLTDIRSVLKRIEEKMK